MEGATELVDVAEGDHRGVEAERIGQVVQRALRRLVHGRANGHFGLELEPRCKIGTSFDPCIGVQD